MAKADKEEQPGIFTITAQQIYEITKARNTIPCSISPDVGLGGGIPIGCIVLIAGKPGFGKTTLALQYASNAQALYGSEIFFFPIEGRLTHHVMNQIRGLNRNKVKVVMPPMEIDEKTNKIISAEKWSSNQWWDAIGETLKNNKNSILIVDSLAALSSEKEQSEGIGYQGRGDAQKLESQFCRIYKDHVMMNENTIFFLTQIQANTSGYGSPTQAKVGNSIKFQSDVTLFGKSVVKWDPQDGKICGHDMVYNVEKSALGPPNLEISIPLRYGYGIDDIQDIVNYCVNWGIVKKSGAWFELPFEEKDGKFTFTEKPTKTPVKIQGLSKTRNWFATNKDQFEIVNKHIRKTIFE